MTSAPGRLPRPEGLGHRSHQARFLPRPEGLGHRKWQVWHRASALCVGALIALAPRAALACPVCFGASDAPMALGMNWGVLTLLGVTLGVLGGFAAFFLRLARRAERAVRRPADRSGPLQPVPTPES